MAPSYYAGHVTYTVSSSFTAKNTRTYNGTAWTVAFTIGAKSLTPSLGGTAQDWRNITSNPEYYEYKVDYVSGSGNITETNLTYGAWTTLSASQYLQIKKTAVGSYTTQVSLQIRRKYEDNAVVVSTSITLNLEITP